VRLLFEAYRGDSRATSVFYFISLGAAVGSAIIRSLAVSCAVRQWVLFGWQIMYLGLLVRLRPSVVPLRSVLSCACSALTAAAFLLLGVHFTWEESAPAVLLVVAEKFALTASVLSCADFVLFLLRIFVLTLHARLAPAGQQPAPNAFDVDNGLSGDELMSIEMGLAALLLLLSPAPSTSLTHVDVVAIPEAALPQSPPPPPPPPPPSPPPPPPAPPPQPPLSLPSAPRLATSLPEWDVSDDATSGEDETDVLRERLVADARERFQQLFGCSFYLH
jgi:hypothetical protein